MQRVLWTQWDNFFERNVISERKSSGSASTRKETSFGSEVKKAPSLGFASISEMNNGDGVVRLGDLDFGLSRCRWQSRQSAERAYSSLAGAMTGCNARKFQRTSPALAGRTRARRLALSVLVFDDSSTKSI